ncbi:MAG: hypothetical protein IJM44_08350 [Ruminococcus sp.]|nr:hypothetical protein [Ruminococcus sp.]
MSDNFRPQPAGAVPVKVERVFDSCSDKDCLCDIPVTLTSGEIPPNINIVRSRAASVSDVCVSVEPVPFNKGFYSVDLSFTFSLEILGYERSCSAPVTLSGTAYAAKNCILYGSDSSVRTFCSGQGDGNGCPCQPLTPTLPKACVSVLEPVILETRLTESCPVLNGERSAVQGQVSRGIEVTLGLFSVVELTRPVTVMVPTLDYRIPRKECCTDSDSPCEAFGRLKFPEEEFSPAALTDCGCGDVPFEAAQG